MGVERMSIFRKRFNTFAMKIHPSTLRQAKTFTILLVAFLVTHPTANLYAQEMPVFSTNQLKFNFNEDGSRYVQMTGLLQGWVRHTEMNPGTTINGYDTDAYTDFSIRRLRFQTYGQLTERVFFYSQFGQNNFNFLSNKFTGSFFHDAVVEVAVDKEKLWIGGGLTGWSGLARYASPSVLSFLTLDAPLYQQATNGVNDQFLRKLSIYAKGQLGKFDYRVAISQPMTVIGAPSSATAPTSERFIFSNEPPKKQLQGYFKYMFFDKESNLTAYHGSNYLGSKSMFNLGAGVIYQPEALWAVGTSGATIYNDMLLLGLDVYYDKPLTHQTAITFYAALTNYDFGSGYFRNVGVNNAANGSGTGNPGGYGGAYPMIGTGNTYYAQAGYLFGQDVISKGGKLQPFASIQLSDYDFSTDNVLMFELGGNYLIHGNHYSKISMMYQGRSTYDLPGTEIVADGSKGMWVLQYQAGF